MERDQSEFGNGLLGRLMRSPYWLPDCREPMRIAFALAPEQPAPRRTSMLALAPLVAALVAALAS
jgi:hypothetical protein